MSRPDIGFAGSEPASATPSSIEEPPSFEEPWQARVFALAAALLERGVLTPQDWTQALGAEIAAAGPHDDGQRAWAHWLAVLERFAAAGPPAGR